jgi:hypothetical protein
MSRSAAIDLLRSKNFDVSSKTSTSQLNRMLEKLEG